MGGRDFLDPRAPVASNVASREYDFQREDFTRVRALIYARAGINLSENKQNMVYSRLSRRLRLHGLGRFSDYLDRLENDARFAADESQEFINALTTNLTSFFREAHHFPIFDAFLRECSSPPKVWCAAASTGEEPYSIAMTMLDASGARPAGSLLATDIDTHVLEVAERGCYRFDAAKVCGETRLRRYFLKGKGAQEGLVRMRTEVQRLVRFDALNLLHEDWPLIRQFGPTVDVIFCRNVMIYFDRKTQKHILSRMAQHLRPGGLLFVGHSENFSDCHDALVLRGKTVYQKR